MSDEQKHTPGPWYSVQYANWFNVQNVDEYSQNNLLDLERCDEAAANARLIAAAPEMFAELERVEWSGACSLVGGELWHSCPSCDRLSPYDDRVTEQFKGMVGHHPQCTLAAAIAKAEGKDSATIEPEVKT